MNPLFQAMNDNNKMDQVANIMRMLKSGNPEQIAQQMMQQNPQFRQFMEQNKGKTPEQVAKEYGVDIGQLKQMMK